MAPMKKEISMGHTEKGVEIFINYVFRDPNGPGCKMSAYAKDETLRDAKEWDVMLTTGTLFPDLKKKTFSRSRCPFLFYRAIIPIPF